MGYRVGTRYDGLLAKLVVHGEDLDVALNRARRALREFRIEGVSTNLEFLKSLLSRDIVGATTDFVAEEPDDDVDVDDDPDEDDESLEEDDESLLVVAESLDVDEVDEVDDSCLPRLSVR